MANYLVTDTQLTSVANAIRTKGGTNSSLAFPSGFTSAIGNIQGDIYDGFGANPEFVQTIWSENITLADTNIDNVTLTNSSQTIRASTNIISNNIILDWNYDYVIFGKGKIEYAYNSDVFPRTLTFYSLVAYIIATYNSGLDKITLNAQDSAGCDVLVSTPLTLCENSLNNFVINAANPSIYYETTTTPNVNYTSGLYGLSTPNIRARTTTLYPQTFIDAIDKNNTKFSFSWILQKYKKSSTSKFQRHEIVENLFLTDYPQYAPQQS